MNNPQILATLSAVFALLGAFNLYTGSRRMRDARRQGTKLRWNKQLQFLTGVEYVLLAFVFLLSATTRQGNIAPGMQGVVVIVYLALLIAAAVVASMVIREGIANARAMRKRGSEPASDARTEPKRSATERRQDGQRAQRQRQRRKNAARVRRQRSGRA